MASSFVGCIARLWIGLHCTWFAWLSGSVWISSCPPVLAPLSFFLSFSPWSFFLSSSFPLFFFFPFLVSPVPSSFFPFGLPCPPSLFFPFLFFSFLFFPFPFLFLLFLLFFLLLSPPSSSPSLSPSSFLLLPLCSSCVFFRFLSLLLVPFHLCLLAVSFSSLREPYGPYSFHGEISITKKIREHRLTPRKSSSSTNIQFINNWLTMLSQTLCGRIGTKGCYSTITTTYHNVG